MSQQGQQAADVQPAAPSPPAQQPAVAAPPPVPPAQQPAAHPPPRQDYLGALLDDIPRHQARLRKLVDSPADKLPRAIVMEMAGTVLSYLLELATHVKEVRDVYGDSLMKVGQRFDQLEGALVATIERLNEVENSVESDSGLDAEEHQALLQLCASAEGMCNILKGASNIDAEATAQLDRELQLVEQCKLILARFEFEAEDEEDDELEQQEQQS
jgi:hypothetical protein